MSYHLDFTNKAEEDIAFHKKSGNKPIQKKLLVLLNELAEHPFTGTGKPEQLKRNLLELSSRRINPLWSRRINYEHLLVYEVIDNIVFILSSKGHY